MSREAIDAGRKTVAIVERLRGGHHETFFVLFCRTVLSLGYRVVGICPEPERVRKRLTKVMGKGDLGVKDLELVKIWQWRVPRFPPGVNARINRFGFFFDVKRKLRMAERRLPNGGRINLVFFACIHDDIFGVPRRMRAGWRWPWSGLYFQAWAFRRRGEVLSEQGGELAPHFLVNPLLRSLAVLDPKSVPYFESFGVGATVFPEVVDDEISTELSGVAKSLSDHAAGRRVIGVVGNIRKSKGVLALAALARNEAEFGDLVFAFVGEMSPSIFSRGEMVFLSEVLGKRANVFSSLEWVESERELNDVILQCDILYAAYEDFPNSSNILSKAARFRKPVIVSDGYLMAERVREFRIGEVVDSGAGQGLGAIIRRMIDDEGAWERTVEPLWDDYLEENSIRCLEERMGELLEASISVRN